MSEYVYMHEPGEAILAEKELLKEHRASVPIETSADFGPDVGMYKSMEDAGILRCITVRFNEELVGYCVNILQESRHNPGTLAAFVDCVYVKPEHRANAGKRLLVESDKYLARIGVERVLHQVMTGGKDFGPVLERMGYKQHAVTYCKTL